MALKILKDPTFTIEAKITLPTDEGMVDQSVTAQFRMLPTDDPEQTMNDFIAKALIRVDGIVDDAGAALPWTDDLSARVLKLPFIAMGLWKAYNLAMTGARAGN